MFRNFFELKSELLTKGEGFSAETLKLLPYEDLIRAAIGDAGKAACDLELVEEERKIRLKSASTMTLSEITSQKMTEDILMRLQIDKQEALPLWGSLSPRAQIYFRIRCLRAHGDNPLPRLKALLELLQADGDPTALIPQVQDLIGIPEAGGVLSLTAIRAAFRGYFEQIPQQLSPWERALCQNLSIQGYTCSAGCFLPATFED